ncbi:IS630 family transposase [Streptomyces althioticus]|jgi:transposase|uniref:IS630 family transposase n=2 Tax=Streptomyces TaxID=1883 RepID=A0ABW6JH77_STRCE|nr:DDE endonuclease [Streptomyces sp. 4F]WTB45811.1 IS630 family transposase [Streptomyces althioticus]ALV50823.1 DDE endonuclease [Streptomyces sp. 4F]ALV52047.1 DDE endonuclease [Streptomyces sp. 4F]ALV54008.1 DDE endonuclease [Streptomyces sp. 4F]
MSRPGPKIPPLSVTDAQRDVLEGWVRRRSTAQSLAQRSRIILACAEGHSIMEVSRRLGVTADMVRTWRRRFLERGLDGLSDEPRPGVPRKITDADVERVIVKTLEEKPKNATHWSTRSMAAATGMSQSTVSRIWRAFALAPHRSQTFKLSTDPLFIDKVRDVVGLYLDPPEKALVLCVDEKSQIQALDRSQPVLPMMPGVPERRSHDYVRAGTTTLFAALEVATGKVIGSLHRRHRAVEFKKFLTKLDMEVPAELDVHLILDNYVTHKTPAVKKWLLAHPRFHLHFTPTSSSWLNLVERWFAELTQKKLKRGVHRSVQALERDIRSWLADWNDHPRPFVWTKTADEILDKVAAYCRRISDSGH